MTTTLQWVIILSKGLPLRKFELDSLDFKEELLHVLVLNLYPLKEYLVPVVIQTVSLAVESLASLQHSFLHKCYEVFKVDSFVNE